MKTKFRWVKFAGCVLSASVVVSLLLITAIRKNTFKVNKIATTQQRNAGAVTPNWDSAFANLPMGFEENRGQAAREVRFVSHGGGYLLSLAPQEADIALIRRKAMSASPLHRAAYLRAYREARRAQKISVVRMHLEGANPAAEIAGTNQLPGKSNYFIGSDSSKWLTDVPSYGRVKYSGIYPGVDLIFYGNQRHLEYDFVVAPGADPKAVTLKVDGARKLAINSQGDLVLSIPDGKVEFKKPVIYQMSGGERREIAGNYALGSGNRVSFAVSEYDRTLPLVIDPILNYSTYLGGSGDETGFDIAVDALGDAFITGSTSSNDFPNISTNAVVPTAPALDSAFVTEIDPTGTTQLYSTYLGGTDDGDTAFAIALDPTGNIYVAGTTFSTDFPTTTNALIQSPITNPDGTAFVTKLNPLAASGAASLLYSSYVGGTAGDFANGIAVDAAGNAYIGGMTLSTPGAPGSGGFAVTAGAFQSAPSNTFGTAFLTRIDTTQSGSASLIYSTYLGGNGANQANFIAFGEQVSGVAVDSSNNAYVTGVTSSTDFPPVNASQGTAVGANTEGGAFVSRFDTTKANAASLVYSTYLEGSVFDAGFAIALGPANVAYVTGTTSSLDFPKTTGAFQTAGATSGVAFVSLIDTALSGGASLKYSSFLGGTGGDDGFGIRADTLGTAYVAGTTASADFPVTPGAFQSARSNPNGDPFITKLNPGGNGAADLVYSTYFGGSGDGSNPDQCFGIAIDSTNNAYITGSTFSGDFPTTAGALQTSLNGTSDAFVAKLPLVASVAISPFSLNFGTQVVNATTLPQTVTVTNNNATALAIASIAVVAVAPPAAGVDYAISSKTCGSSLAAGASCTVDVTFTPSVASGETANLVFTDADSTSPQSVSLSGTGTGTGSVVVLMPTSLTFTSQLVTTTSDAQTINLKNTGNAVLNIASITISGDFTLTNPCGTTLAAGSTCVLSVKFAPTATGTRTGSITITDDANGSPQTVGLTGTGSDFTVTAPSTVTVSRGSNQMFNVTVTPLGGFNQAVALSCTGAPNLATCAVSPSPVTPDGTNPVNGQVTITTKGDLVPSTPTRTPPASTREIMLLMLALALGWMAFVTRGRRIRLGLASAMLIVIALAGCSGGAGTPKGTSTLTLTGSSGGVSHTATVSLTVN
ncbi:MAG: SBBP repeat-containing protein [Candidatus Acidiferrales bacterium]